MVGPGLITSRAKAGLVSVWTVALGEQNLKDRNNKTPPGINPASLLKPKGKEPGHFPRGINQIISVGDTHTPLPLTERHHGYHFLSGRGNRYLKALFRGFLRFWIVSGGFFQGEISGSRESTQCSTQCEPRSPPKK